MYLNALDKEKEYPSYADLPEFFLLKNVII